MTQTKKPHPTSNPKHKPVTLKPQVLISHPRRKKSALQDALRKRVLNPSALNSALERPRPIHRVVTGTEIKLFPTPCIAQFPASLKRSSQPRAKTLHLDAAIPGDLLLATAGSNTTTRASIRLINSGRNC